MSADVLAGIRAIMEESANMRDDLLESIVQTLMAQAGEIGQSSY
jgi:hypothetical protein